MHNHPAALLALPVLLFFATTAPAQSLYRCGNTFSQVPCGKETAPARALPSAGNGSEPETSAKDLCELTVRQAKLLNGPDSAKIRTVRDKMVVIEYAGQSVAAFRYTMHISTRNAYGDYVQERPYSCFVSEDGQRVLQMGAANP